METSDITDSVTVGDMISSRSPAANEKSTVFTDMLSGVFDPVKKVTVPTGAPVLPFLTTSNVTSAAGGIFANAKRLAVP